MDASRVGELEYLLLDLRGDLFLPDTMMDDIVNAAASDGVLGHKPLKDYKLFLLTAQQDTALRQAARNVGRDMRELLKAYYGDDDLP